MLFYAHLYIGNVAREEKNIRQTCVGCRSRWIDLNVRIYTALISAICAERRSMSYIYRWYIFHTHTRVEERGKTRWRERKHTRWRETSSDTSQSHSHTDIDTQKDTHILRTHIVTHTHRDTHAQTHTQTHTDTNTDTHICTHMHTYTHTHSDTHTCTTLGCLPPVHPGPWYPKKHTDTPDTHTDMQNLLFVPYQAVCVYMCVPLDAKPLDTLIVDKQRVVHVSLSDWLSLCMYVCMPVCVSDRTYSYSLYFNHYCRIIYTCIFAATHRSFWCIEIRKCILHTWKVLPPYMRPHIEQVTHTRSHAYIHEVIHISVQLAE
jgi:hypothetical protein